MTETAVSTAPATLTKNEDTLVLKDYVVVFHKNGRLIDYIPMKSDGSRDENRVVSKKYPTPQAAKIIRGRLLGDKTGVYLLDLLENIRHDEYLAQRARLSKTR